MCSRNPSWEQSSLSPETSITGSCGSADAQSSTSSKDAEASRPLTDLPLDFELTLRCSGVTLTNRLTLPLSAALSEKGADILAQSVAALTTDAAVLAAYGCVKP